MKSSYVWRFTRTVESDDAFSNMEEEKLHSTLRATSDESSSTVRNRDFTSQLVGRCDFGASFYLLVIGEKPIDEEARLRKAMLVTIVKYCMTPRNRGIEHTRPHRSRCRGSSRAVSSVPETRS